MHPWATVNAITALVDLPNPLEQRSIALATIRFCSTEPRIVTAAGNAQPFAQVSDA